MKFLKIPGNILLLITLLSFSKSSYPQSSDTVYISANTIKVKTIELDKAWRYHQGDNPLWASPDFNDTDWDTVRTSMYFEDFPINRWAGTGWFRKVIAIDSVLYNKTLYLRIHHYGASEIYVNGKLQCSIGKISSNPDEIELYHHCPNPVPLELDSNKYYTLAVRYLMPESTVESFWYSKIKTHIGFLIRINDLERSIKSLEKYDSFYLGEIGYVGMIGPLLTLSVLFFILFFFSSKKKEYLYYSLYLVFLVVGLIFDWLAHTIQTDFIYKYFYRVGDRSTVLLGSVTLLACFYTIFYQKLLKPFWYFFTFSILIIIYNAIYLDNAAFLLYSGFNVLIGIECVRIIVIALKNKKRNAWVIGIGFIVTFLAFTVGMLVVSGIVNLWSYADVLTYVFEFGFPVSIMVYLVRSYSDININLKKQLVTVKELSQKELEQKLRAQRAEAENERKSKELEQARQLQLSMLPKKIPSLPNLDIAVYMKTATEVGGDYYDFYKSEDNALNIVIGDATGHGINAGMMVGITKGLFQNLAPYADLEEVVNRFNHSLQSMKLQPMYMTLRILRIKESHLEVIGAGMFPFLIFEKATDIIREVESSGPPLGAFPQFNYTNNKFELSSGDVIVLMTDGFTERFNVNNEMIGDKRAKDILVESAGESAGNIIERFVKESDEWGGDRPQDDDSTFVVIKMK
jgi:serine phosphatase RsbU (regulator of sigma subunit)